MDGEVKIKTAIDNSGLQKDAKKTQGIIDGLVKKLSSSKMSNIGASISGIGAAFQLVGKACNTVKAAVTDLTETYKVQEKAEVQLETAARNNPYLSEYSVQQLKEYASGLQQIGTVGDETLIPMMAQLAASGRTYNEIQQIMSAALDASASGAISLDSAVQGLNMSYSGQIGALGRQLPMLKDLTAEELKSGKAIEVVAKAYKGMAEQTAKAIGSTQKLKNAWGDFKETIGRGINNVLSPIENAVTTIITKINDAWNNAKNIEEAAKAEAASLDFDTNNSVDNRIEEDKKAKKEKKKQQKEEEKAAKQHEETLNQIAISGANERIKIWQEENKKTNRQIKTLQNEIKFRFQEFEGMGSFSPINYDGFIEGDEAQRALIIEKAQKEELEAIAGILGVSADLVKDMLIAEKQLKGIEAERKEDLEEIYDNSVEIKNANEAQAKAESDAAAKTKERQEALNSATENYNKIIADRDAAIAQAKRISEVTGEEIDQRQILNAELEAYLKMAQDPLLPTKTEEQKKRVEEMVKSMKDLNSALETIEKTTGDVIADADKLLTPSGEEKLSNAIRTAIDALKEQKELFEGNTEAFEEFEKKIEKLEKDTLPKVLEAEKSGAFNSLKETLSDINTDDATKRIEEIRKRILEINEEFNSLELEQQNELNEAKKEAIKKLEEEITEIQNEQNQQRIQNISDMVSQIGEYVSQTVSIMKDASNLMLQTVQNQTDAEIATLEAKYLKGEISEKEYEEKKIEAKKKAAKEEYKIQMFEWSASLLQATANIAQGVTKAIAQGGVAGLVTGLLVGAAGGLQIASISAAKPIPPSFAGGGIVPGNSYTGDKVRANVNSGEMILNATQQKALWEVANGRNANGSSGANITINNSAANLVSAQPKITKDQIEIIIDARVNDSLKNGRYDQSLTMANQGMSGDYYGI